MIIAFGNQKRNGKDQCAIFAEKHLKERGHPVYKTSFAQRLKDVCYTLYAWGGLQPAAFYETFPELKEVVLPKLGKSPRQIYIEVGDKMREVHPDVWIRCVTDDAGLKSNTFTIISDLRYRNEAMAVKLSLGVTVKVLRPGFENSDTNAAERELQGYDFDYTIVNNGTLEDLDKKVFEMLKFYGMV
jgi:hypothetical protein